MPVKTFPARCANPCCRSRFTGVYRQAYCTKQCQARYQTWRKQRGAELLDALLADDASALITKRTQINLERKTHAHRS